MLLFGKTETVTIADFRMLGAIFSGRASLVAQLVKNPPAMWETWVQSLGWEDLLEKGMATHSNIFAPLPQKGASKKYGLPWWLRR